MIRIDLSKRSNLRNVSILFFGNDITGCVSGEYSPKSWQWRKCGFVISKHGGFLAYLMFNGVFERESEILVWKFFEKYTRRILGIEKKPRKCFSERVTKSGLSYALIYSAYSFIANKQMYIRKEVIEKYPIIRKVFFDKRLDKEHITIKCHNFDFVTESYRILRSNYHSYIKIEDTPAEQLVKVITGEIDVYDIVFSFNDAILVGATLRVLTTSRPTKKIINKVETFINDYFTNEIGLSSEKVDELINKFHYIIDEVK